MRLNRFWLLALGAIFAVSTLVSAPAIANSKDKDKQTAKAPAKATTTPKTSAKTTAKTSNKSTKKPKTVRVTVTRSAEPVVPARPSFATALGLRGQHDELSLKSSVAMVVNQDTKEVYFEKNPSVSLPIASITKLMTAMVV